MSVYFLDNLIITIMEKEWFKLWMSRHKEVLVDYKIRLNSFFQITIIQHSMHSNTFQTRFNFDIDNLEWKVNHF